MSISTTTSTKEMSARLKKFSKSDPPSSELYIPKPLLLIGQHKTVISLVKLLIEKYEADVNLVSEKGETPLMSAIKRNHVKLVKLEKGADPNYIGSFGLRTIVQFSRVITTSTIPWM